jgi:hypothetical protein
MFITLLVVTFVISLAVALLVIAIFSKPLDTILHRIIADEISRAWVKYLKFAILVVGVSSGVRIWALEKYITPSTAKDAVIIELTRDRWVLEIYRTVLDSLQGIAWMLLIFFIFAMLAFVLVRIFEMRKPRPEGM